MLYLDQLHLRGSNGNRALIMENPDPYEGTLRFYQMKDKELQAKFKHLCCEVTLGSHRTFFEFPGNVTQETIDEFTTLYNKSFGTTL